ncbi:uncharacterized protein [Phaenicophaeus curvirostris]|uniref:uncharacterized protein n=1 Tax=Phaenicophaeus curvirostris TaxID=33595 RepID=UPI0037F0994E
MACRDWENERIAATHPILRSLRRSSPVTPSLVLRALLRLSERAEMVLGWYCQSPKDTEDLVVSIEVMRDSSIFRKEFMRLMHDACIKNPAFWLAEIPNVMAYIHESLGHLHSRSAGETVGSLLFRMTKYYPMEVATTLWRMFPPTDSSALPLWDLIFCVPQTLEGLLKGLSLLLQDKLDEGCDLLPEDSCILLLAVMAGKDWEYEETAATYNIWWGLRYSSPVTLSRLLSALLRLSERAKMVLGQYLQPAEDTEIILTSIEAMSNSSIFKKEVMRLMHDAFFQNPAFWLAEIPNVMAYVHESLGHLNTRSAREMAGSLLFRMTYSYPTAVATTLWRMFPPNESSALPLWEIIFSVPETLEELLQGLTQLLQDKQEMDSDALPEGSCILLLAAQEMLGLLPDLMGVMNDSNSDIALNALQVILSVMGHLKKEEASPFAVQLTEQLLPVFNHESSNVRETSITLFRDQLKNVAHRNKQQMKKNVQMALLPLFLHLNDETERVAKASAEALLAAAEFLRWAQLKHLVQMQQTWSIAECLLAQRRSKTEDYLDQSVPYLKDAQKDLRLAAVRFIGRAVQHLKDQSPGKMEMICFALKPLREDSDIAVRSLATQTILIMNRPRQQTRARRILQALRCWGL